MSRLRNVLAMLLMAFAALAAARVQASQAHAGVNVGQAAQR